MARHGSSRTETEVFQLHEVYSEIQSNFNAELPLLTFLTVSTHLIITFRILCLLMFAKICSWKHKDGDLQLEAHLMSHLKFEKSFEELKSGSFSL